VRVLMIILTLLFVFSASLPGLELKAKGPGESTDYTLNKRFSFNDVLFRLGQVKSALNSFASLTSAAEGKIAKEELQRIGNVDWETQNIGFPNWLTGIEGALRLQNYEIKKLQYELAFEKSKQGELDANEVAKFRKLFEDEEASFQKFWVSFRVVD